MEMVPFPKDDGAPFPCNLYAYDTLKGAYGECGVKGIYAYEGVPLEIRCEAHKDWKA